MMIPPSKTFLESSLYDILGLFMPSYLLTFIHDKLYPGTFPKGLLSRLVIPSTITHEEMHWHQMAGTSWGNLCLLLRQCQADNFINHHSYIAPLSLTIQDLKDIRILNDYSIDPKISTRKTESALFLQQWRDFAVTYEFFTRGDTTLKASSITLDCIAPTLSDYYSIICHQLGWRETRYVNELDALCTFTAITLPKLPHSKTPLSVNDLLEGQARASEVIFLLGLGMKFNNIFNIRDYNKLIQPFLHTSTYWRAFQDFLYITKGDSHDKNILLTELTKFCIIIDLALAVPWPPYTTGAVLGKLPWELFYPTHRFFIACQVAREIDFRLDVLDAGSHLEYANKICEILGWPTPNQLAQFYLHVTNEQDDRFAKMWQDDEFDEKEINMHRYYRYIFRRFSELRLKSPTYIANLGITQIAFVEDNIDYLTDDKNSDWIGSPLRTIGKSKKVLTPLKRRQFHWLVGQLLYNSILNDFVLQSKVVDQSSFPFEVPEHMVRILDESFRRMYKFSPFRT